MKTFFLRTIVSAAVAVLAVPQFAQAAGLFTGQDIDPRFRAKIMKEKAKQNTQLANDFNFNSNAGSAQDPQCGSQNIGNVDTGGQPGSGPREVFVFAPNAINLVTAQGCR